MIIFFGPAGSGKSVQGQILSARHGWRWLSAGQLLRDSHDKDILAQLPSGDLVDSNKVNAIVEDALKRANDIERVILDGYPRELDQAKWLIESSKANDRSIKLAIVLEVPREELLKRLTLRGRKDDNPEAIEERLNIYRQEIYPILTYLSDQKVKISHIDGTGTVGQVHDRIEAELAACSLV